MTIRWKKLGTIQREAIPCGRWTELIATVGGTDYHIGTVRDGNLLVDRAVYEHYQTQSYGRVKDIVVPLAAKVEFRGVMEEINAENVRLLLGHDPAEPDVDPGDASPWAASEIAGLSAWFRASDLESAGYDDGDLVDVWPDASGNGNDLAQADSAHRPKFRNPGGGVPPSVQFGPVPGDMGFPADKWMQLGSAVTGVRVAASLHSWGSISVADTTLLGGAVGAGYDDFFGGSPAGLDHPFLRSDLAAAVVTGGTAYQNGVEMAATAAQKTLDATALIFATSGAAKIDRIGVDAKTGIAYFRGKVYEVGLWSQPISDDADRQRLEGYLAHVGGGYFAAAVLPADHPYRQFPPSAGGGAVMFDELRQPLFFTLRGRMPSLDGQRKAHVEFCLWKCVSADTFSLGSGDGAQGARFRAVALDDTDGDCGGSAGAPYGWVYPSLDGPAPDSESEEGPQAWSPSDVASILAWWRADAIEGLSDGDDVSAWPDSSGNGNDLTQSSAANKPHYKTGILNGLPVVRVTNASDSHFMSLPGEVQAKAFAMVTKCGTALTYGTFFGHSTLYDYVCFGTAWVSSYYAATPVKNGTAWQDGADDWGSPNDLQTLVRDTSWHVIASSHNQSYSPGYGRIDQMFRDRTFANWGHDGDVAEVILFSDVLSDSDRQKVEGYLAWKWGLQASLPAGHPYHDAAP